MSVVTEHDDFDGLMDEVKFVYEFIDRMSDLKTELAIAIIYMKTKVKKEDAVQPLRIIREAVNYYNSLGYEAEN